MVTEDPKTYFTAWLGAAIVFLLTYLLVRRERKYKNFPPGPTGLPVIGYLPFLEKHVAKTYLKLSKKYGPIFSVSFGMKRCIVLNDYDSIHEALAVHGDAFSGRPKISMFEEITKGYGIIFRSFDEIFKEQRKFALRTLKEFGVGKRSMENRITEEAEHLLKEIELKNGESFDCKSAFEISATNVMCNIVLGSRFSHDDKTFQKMLTGIAEGSDEERDAELLVIVTVASFLRWIPPFSGAYRRYVNNAGYVLKALKNILEEHKKTFVENDIRDFIDAFLREIESRGENHRSFKEIQLFHVIRDFFQAASETTSTMLRWCILSLAHYPEVQQKVADEVKNVIGDDMPSMSHKDDMPYTSAFLHEILRHRTLSPIAAPHLTSKNVTIRGYDIPKGTMVWVNLHGGNYDVKYHKNPEEFKPERFIDEDGKFIPDRHMLTFSAGPRRCLGEQLAKMKYFLLFVNIIRNYEIVPDPNKPLPSFDDAIPGFAEEPHKFEVYFKRRTSLK